jgi:hypothetical protein
MARPATARLLMAALIAFSALWLATPAACAGTPPPNVAALSTGWEAGHGSDWPTEILPSRGQGRRLMQTVRPDGNISYTMPSNATVYSSPAGGGLLAVVNSLLGGTLGNLGLYRISVTSQPKIGSVVVSSTTGDFTYTAPAVSYGGERLLRGDCCMLLAAAHA